jgi:hypothetical protein
VVDGEVAVGYTLEKYTCKSCKSTITVVVELPSRKIVKDIHTVNPEGSVYDETSETLFCGCCGAKGEMKLVQSEASFKCDKNGKVTVQ